MGASNPGFTSDFTELAKTGLLTTVGFGLAMAVGKVKVKPASAAEALAISKGNQPQGAWCDNFGYVWNLSSAGASGRVVAVQGDVNFCGAGPASGTLTLASGLPLDKFLSEYRKANTGPVSAEQRAEMRAAFGPGQTVVNIITGRRTRT